MIFEIISLEAYTLDKYKIEQAVRLFLEGIGENPDREGLIDTPSRVSNMCEELFAGLNTSAESHLSKRQLHLHSGTGYH